MIQDKSRQLRQEALKRTQGKCSDCGCTLREWND